MATILLTWELGGGLGHLVNLLPLAKGLFERGHRVVAALRDLSRAEDVFGGVEVTYLQAPVINRPVFQIIEPVRNFAQLLFNNGFSDPAELKIMSRAWLNLYEYVRPDLIVFDHSPTALLAARSCGAKRRLWAPAFFARATSFPYPTCALAGRGLAADATRTRIMCCTAQPALAPGRIAAGIPGPTLSRCGRGFSADLSGIRPFWPARYWRGLRII